MTINRLELVYEFQSGDQEWSHFRMEPGVQHLPRSAKHVYFNASFGTFSAGDLWGPLTNKEHTFHVEFEKDVPEDILRHKPLYMLIQWVDMAHVRVGFKAHPADPWYLSKIYDYSLLTGGEQLVDFGQMDWSTSTGRAWGAPPGSRPFQKIPIDYIHYRYRLSA
jgi:hypothetical protein